MTYYQWNDLVQISNDVAMQGFTVGFFASVITIWPVAMLLLLPHDGWRNGEYSARDKAKIARLEKEIVDLNAELIDHKQVIDNMLRNDVNEFIETKFGTNVERKTNQSVKDKQI